MPTRVLVSLIAFLVVTCSIRALAQEDSLAVDRQQLELIMGMIERIENDNPDSTRLPLLRKRRDELAAIVRYRERKAGIGPSEPETASGKIKINKYFFVEDGETFFAEKAGLDATTGVLKTKSGREYRKGFFREKTGTSLKGQFVFVRYPSHDGGFTFRAEEVIAEFENGAIATDVPLTKTKFRVWTSGSFVKEAKDGALVGKLVIVMHPDGKGGFYLRGERVKRQFTDGSIAAKSEIVENDDVVGFAAYPPERFAVPVTGRSQLRQKYVAVTILGEDRKKSTVAAKVLQESVGDLVAVNIRSENSAQFLAFHRSEIVESVKSLPKNEWVGIKVIDRSEKKVRIHGQKIQAVFKDGSVAVDLESSNGEGLQVFKKSDVIWPKEKSDQFGVEVVIQSRDPVHGNYKRKVAVLAVFEDGSILIDERTNLNRSNRVVQPSEYSALKNTESYLVHPYVYVRSPKGIERYTVTAEYEDGHLQVKNKTLAPGNYLTVVDVGELGEKVFETSTLKFQDVSEILSDGTIISNNRAIDPGMYKKISDKFIGPAEVWYKTSAFSKILKGQVAHVFEDGSLITDTGAYVTQYLTSRPERPIRAWFMFGSLAKGQNILDCAKTLAGSTESDESND